MKLISKSESARRCYAHLAMTMLIFGICSLRAGPAPLDFDGDGKTDFVVVGNSGGQALWTIVTSGGPPLPHPAMRPVIQQPIIKSGQFQFTFNTQTGTNYTVQFKSSLAQANWQTLNVITGTGTLVTNKTTIGTNRVGYFRVTVP